MGSTPSYTYRLFQPVIFIIFLSINYLRVIIYYYSLKISRFHSHGEVPTLEPGQLFSVSGDAPAYRIEEAGPVAYAAGSLLDNPFGTWWLVPLETTH
ncbi:hypothetical protein [Paraburkholderia eburnea]|uniref:hypothetical protein n=1 Tax=Paraburkholderia eburnea TaxID=1189126 RepID=UPI0011B0DBD0|nr:hypothetical protein [Paraburkholderia eburnea]